MLVGRALAGAPAWAQELEDEPDAEIEASSVDSIATDLGPAAPAERKRLSAYYDIDVLGWSLQPAHLPPLLTTSPQGTSPSSAGELGRSTTQILYGDQSVNDAMRPGLRFQFGLTGPERKIAWDSQFYFLSAMDETYYRSSDFSNGSADAVLLTRPFYRITPWEIDPSAQIIASPLGITTANVNGAIEIAEENRAGSLATGFRFFLPPEETGRRHTFWIGYRSMFLWDQLNFWSDTVWRNRLPRPTSHERSKRASSLSRTTNSMAAN